MLIIKDNDHANFELDKDENVYKLKHRKEIKIGFFKNGIAIENYPFFEYTSIESQNILGDIIEGYSPYIFKQKYPKGVLMQLQNKLHDKYDLNNNNNNKNTNISASNVQGIFDVKCSNSVKLSKDEFLNKLPKSILKNGKVYNIRDDISNIISGKVSKNLNELIFDDKNENENFSNKEIIDYSADRIEEINIYDNDIIKKDYYLENKVDNNNNIGELKENIDLDNEKLINNQICRFKITIPILNGKNLLVNISKNKFIKDIYSELLDLIKKCSKLPKYKLLNDLSKIKIDVESFVLLSTFPRKEFHYEHKLTLEENKLFPTSVFIFEEKKKI